jgi:hypothetical protein
MAREALAVHAPFLEAAFAEPAPARRTVRMMGTIKTQGLRNAPDFHVIDGNSGGN